MKTSDSNKRVQGTRHKVSGPLTRDVGRRDDMMIRMIGLLGVLSLVGCVSTIQSVRLPVSMRVVDASTLAPVSGATVELQWRSGFQGYYWGKSVRRTADARGCVTFTPPDIDPVSEDGYTISKKPVNKIFVSCILVRADGYEVLKLMNPEMFDELRLKLIGAANNTSEGIRRPAGGSPKPSM